MTTRQVDMFELPEPAPPQREQIAIATGPRVSDPVLALLRSVVIVNNTVRPLPKAAPEVYDELNDVLTRLRGAWKRNKGHVFPYDPTAAIDAVIASGRMPAKNPLAYFPTPAELAADIVRGLEVATEPMFILEPSAGAGALVAAARDRWPRARITGVELDPLNAAMLEGACAVVAEADFLAVDFGGQLFDVIIMNPPFAVDGDPVAWETHLRRAFSLLAPGGVLACVAPRGTWEDSSKKRLKALRGWLSCIGAKAIDHPPGAFASSGTGVKTCTIVITQGAGPAEPIQAAAPPPRAAAVYTPEPVEDLGVILAEIDKNMREADQAMRELWRELADGCGINIPGRDEPDDQEWL
jgi:hypothetical protein